MIIAILKDPFFATCVVNLSLQLFVMSLIGCVLLVLVRKSEAPIRSLVATTTLLSMLVLVCVSLVFQIIGIGTGSLISFAPHKLETAKTNVVQRGQLPVNATSEFQSDTGISANSTHLVDSNSGGINTVSAKLVLLTTLPINCFGIAWILGFLWCLFKFFYYLIFLKGFTNGAAIEVENKFLKILKEVSEDFRFKKRPRIFITKAVDSPVTIGLFNVLVLIPEHLHREMTVEEFKSILFHEFAHIFHKDQLYGILNRLILGFNWWNPLVYHISAERELAREDICDNYAIKGLNSVKVYANSLVNLAEKVCLISTLPATAGMAGRKSCLESRIRKIFSKERKMVMQTRGSSKLAAAALSAALVCVIGIGQVSLAGSKKQTAKKSESAIALKKKELSEKLDSMVVDHLKLTEVPLTKVVGMLAKLSKKLDPKKKGVNFYLKLDDKSTKPSISLELSKMKMSQVLEFICRGSNSSFKIEDSGVYISQNDDGGNDSNGGKEVPEK